MRFIPASAGYTWQLEDKELVSPVYPRWRGEHIHLISSLKRNIGLSPLTRGTPHRTSTPPIKNRFIPACAGNTISTATLCSRSVYPRSRGEHELGQRVVNPARGLSPLARGTRALATHCTDTQRFIPARAGNTPAFHQAPGRGSVYPRSRGEHIAGVACAKNSHGLSPLARGTLILVFSSRWLIRFIPARAGNTSSSNR